MDPTPPPGSLFCSEGLLNVSVISASLFPLISLSHNQTETLSHSRYWHIKSQWNLINLPDNVRRYLVRPSILKCQRCCYQYCFSLNFSMTERYLCFLCIVLSIPFLIPAYVLHTFAFSKMERPQIIKLLNLRDLLGVLRPLLISGHCHSAYVTIMRTVSIKILMINGYLSAWW